MQVELEEVFISALVFAVSENLVLNGCEADKVWQSNMFHDHDVKKKKKRLKGKKKFIGAWADSFKKR